MSKKDPIKEIGGFNPLGKGKKLDCDTILKQVRFLQGKVLTVMDASFQDGSQKKAVKDLVNKLFSDQQSWIWQLCYPETRMLTEDEANSTLDVENIKNEANLA